MEYHHSGQFPAQFDDEGYSSGNFIFFFYTFSYIFIDRNGDYFSLILDFLRTGSLDVPQHFSRKALLREFEYYQIPFPNYLSDSANENTIFRLAEPHRIRAREFLDKYDKSIKAILERQVVREGRLSLTLRWDWDNDAGEYVEENGLPREVTKLLISLIDVPACKDELFDFWTKDGFNVTLIYTSSTSSLIFSSPKRVLKPIDEIIHLLKNETIKVKK